LESNIIRSQFAEYFKQVHQPQTEENRTRTQLFNWYPDFFNENGVLCVRYKGNRSPFDQKPWRSFNIVERISNNVFKTKSGNVYELIGDSAKEKGMEDNSIPQHIKIAFLTGVPRDWKEILTNPTVTQSKPTLLPPQQLQQPKNALLPPKQNKQDDDVIIVSDDESPVSDSPVNSVSPTFSPEIPRKTSRVAKTRRKSAEIPTRRKSESNRDSKKRKSNYLDDYFDDFEEIVEQKPDVVAHVDKKQRRSLPIETSKKTTPKRHLSSEEEKPVRLRSTTKKQVTKTAPKKSAKTYRSSSEEEKLKTRNERPPAKTKPPPKRKSVYDDVSSDEEYQPEVAKKEVKPSPKKISKPVSKPKEGKWKWKDQTHSMKKENSDSKWKRREDPPFRHTIRSPKHTRKSLSLNDTIQGASPIRQRSFEDDMDELLDDDIMSVFSK
jgi:hypothetical protein